MQLLQSKLEQFREAHGIAGFSVAVTNREKTLLATGIGTENIEHPEQRVSEHSLFRIASLTKLTTALTVLRLCDRGLLSLDAPVKTYVPWLELSEKHASNTVTLRHLLSHTAGLPVEYTPEGPRDEAALEPSLKAELPVAALHALPGDGVFLYSNLGIRLASLCAERVTGKKWSELATALVLAPLGMTETAFYREKLPLSVSLPHERSEDGTLRVDYHIKENAARMAAGGLYSNANDLCKLARCFLNDTQSEQGEMLLSPSLLAQMRRPHGHYTEAQGGDAYGLCMRQHRLGDRVLYGHFGSAPPYSSALYTDPVSGLGVVALFNSPCEPARDELMQLLLDAFQ